MKNSAKKKVDEAEQFHIEPEPLDTPLYEGFYHLGCVVHPITKALIQELIDSEVFDPKYGARQNGIRGIYQAQLEDNGKSDRDRPIVRLYTARVEGKLVGVILARQVRQPQADYVIHLYVKPEFRLRGIGKRLIYSFKSICNLPGMAMEETELSKTLLTQNPTIAPIRRPTQLDRDYERCMRTLTRAAKWTDGDGSQLCHDTVRETLQAQHDLIKALRKQINPYDNSVIFSDYARRSIT